MGGGEKLKTTNHSWYFFLRKHDGELIISTLVFLRPKPEDVLCLNSTKPPPAYAGHTMGTCRHLEASIAVTATALLVLVDFEYRGYE